MLFVALALVTGAGVAAFTVLKPLISKITGVGGVNEDMDFTGPGEGEVNLSFLPESDGGSRNLRGSRRLSDSRLPLQFM